MVMELIREQGFREQRGEYGSRAGGGDSLDVSICLVVLLEICALNLSYSYYSPLSVLLGSSATLCSWNCHWQKRRDDQENPERHRRQNSVQTR